MTSSSQAIRATKNPPEDTRTGAGERYGAMELAEAPLWPLVVVLAEVVTEATAELRKAEPKLMAKLAKELSEASELRRKAEVLRAEARMAEWQVVRTSRWILATTDGGAFANQPRPRPCSPPPSFTGEGIELGRPWWRQSNGEAA